MSTLRAQVMKYGVRTAFAQRVRGRDGVILGDSAVLGFAWDGGNGYTQAEEARIDAGEGGTERTIVEKIVVEISAEFGPSATRWAPAYGSDFGDGRGCAAGIENGGSGRPGGAEEEDRHARYTERSGGMDLRRVGRVDDLDIVARRTLVVDGLWRPQPQLG